MFVRAVGLSLFSSVLIYAALTALTYRDTSTDVRLRDWVSEPEAA